MLEFQQLDRKNLRCVTSNAKSTSKRYFEERRNKEIGRNKTGAVTGSFQQGLVCNVLLHSMTLGCARTYLWRALVSINYAFHLMYLLRVKIQNL